MRIKLYGIDKEAVVSASASITDGDHLSILINTRDRYVGFHRAGGSLAYMGEEAEHHGQDAVIRKHDCIQIYSANEESERDTVICEVVFIAENDQEEILLKGACYTSQEKDQIELLKVNRAMKLDVEQLAEFRHLPTMKI